MKKALAELLEAEAVLPKDVVLPLLVSAKKDLTRRLEAQGVLGKLAEQLNEALADEQAGKFAEALEKIAKIRAGLPKNIKVDTTPIDEAEKRIRAALKKPKP